MYDYQMNQGSVWANIIAVEIGRLKPSGREFVQQLSEQIRNRAKCTRLAVDHCIYGHEDALGRVMMLLHYVCQVITLDLIFFFYQSCRYLASNMNTHRSTRECVVIMFYIVYYRLCFSTPVR